MSVISPPLGTTEEHGVRVITQKHDTEVIVENTQQLDAEVITQNHDTETISEKHDADVIVVGAGPVGLLMALKLGLGGVKTIVIEKHDRILAAPRAIAYLPIVNRELNGLGLLGDILKYAHCSELGPCWRNMNGIILAGLGHDKSIQDHDRSVQGQEEPVQGHDPSQDSYKSLQNHDKPLQNQSRREQVQSSLEDVLSKLDSLTLMIGQDIFAQIILDHLETRCQGIVEVQFGTTCLGVQQSFGLAEVLVNSKTSTEETLLSSQWLVGADGANSFVRKASCIPFEGTTWSNFRFTASDIEYKFDHEGGYRPINYIVDAEEWAIIAKAGIGDVWRIAYGERTHLPEDDLSLLERSKLRIPRYLPGSKDYKLKRLKPYTALQRCASTFKKGHILLVGDAAHSNNPVGGLGLTSGILDAIAVGNSLVRCLRHQAGEGLIEEAVTTQRSSWMNQINPATQTNFQRLFSQDPTAEAERRTFFDKVNTDPTFPAQLGRDMDDLFKNNFEAA